MRFGGGLVFLYALVVCAVPLSRVMLGPVPLYFIDVLAFALLLLNLTRVPTMVRRHSRMSAALALFLLSLIPTVMAEIARMGLAEPMYMFGRTVLHVVNVWVLGATLRKPAMFKHFIVGASLGLLITATVATLHSLPLAGPWVRANVMTIDILFPRGDLMGLDPYGLSSEAEAQRGNSLIGKSNITGAVIVTLIPFLIGALRYASLGPAASTLLKATLLMSVFALLFTYSRSNYLAVALMLLAYLFVARRMLARRLLPLLAIAAVVIGAAGVQSSAFKFDFVVAKFDLGNEEYTGNNLARRYAYTRPLERLYSDPGYFVRGAGRTDRKLREADADASILQLTDNEMHSVFGASIFYRGFLAMVAIFYIYYLAARLSYSAMKFCDRKRISAKWLVTASLISMVALLPPWAFTHYLVSSITGHTYFFLLVALVLTSHEYVRAGVASRRRNSLEMGGAGMPAQAHG